MKSNLRRLMAWPRRGHPALRPAAILTLCAIVTGCGEPAHVPAVHDVVLIVVDTLRADHLGSYGYRRETSPFIDSLAARGVVFDDATSNSSLTRESIASLFTGRLPSMSGAAGWNAAPRSPAPHLAEVFQQIGYRTGFFTDSSMMKDRSFGRGFDTVEQIASSWDTSGLGGEVSQRALEFVRRVGDAPFFLYVHYLDPHAPYDPPEDLLERFDPPAVERPPSLYQDVRPNCAELIRSGFGPGDPSFENLVARYDAEIAATDRAIQRLFDGLRESNRNGDTLVVLTADHGEEFLEHGFVDHAWTLYHESVHVPLVFWAPHLLEAARYPDPVSLVDIFPTLVAMLDLPAKGGLDGQALFRHREGRFRPVLGPRAVIAELLVGHRNMVRRVREGNLEYFSMQRWLAPEERQTVDLDWRLSSRGKTLPRPPLWAPAIKEEIYEIDRDPFEQHDQARNRSGALRRFRGLLATYRLRSIREGFDREPGASIDDLSDEEIELLRSLGYL